MSSSDEDDSVVNTEYAHADESQLIETADGGMRVGNIYIAPPGKPYSAEDGSQPRLIITKIINSNFKSYVGEVQLGPFHECFNAIIGPNGSGKSNVIDSMLFVFGYRANKIRCKNLKVLLHKSTTHGQKTSCRVAIHFKQIIERNGKYENVPDSEFFISRSAYNDGNVKSDYTINNKSVPFIEVANLLKTHHVDLLHNRFLILQGEVESIAMMKCKGQNENESGLLEYLEDIIGTTRFKKPLAKIEERIEILNDERTEKYNRCKLSEREMNDLATPYQIAIAYIDSENDFIRAKNLYVQKYVSDHKNQLREYLGIHDDITTQVRAHDEQIKMIVEEKITKEKQIQQEIEAHEEMLKEKEDVKQSITNLRNNQKGIQVLVDSTIKRRKTITNQITKEETNVTDYKKIPDRNSQEIVECENKTEKVTKQLADAERTFEENLISLRALTEPLVEAKEKLEIEMDHLLKTVDESKSEYQLAESTLQILLHSETTEIRKYETLKNSYEDSRKSFNEKQSKLQNSNINGLKQMLVAKEEELRINKKEEKKLTQDYRMRRADIDAKTQALQKFKSNNKVLDYIMKLKLEGKLPGVMGRLGDLGGIDAKYDIAISTCCGRLDNIIVDTVSTAQQCIEYLKRSNVGRATFVTLEKVQHLMSVANRPIHLPENVPRIYDLIKVEDERVLPAFYFSVRNTVVAKDLEQGTRIAFGAQRFRVITLKGELIEMSGTMSGGGKQFFSGRMGESVQTKTSVDDLNSSLTTKNFDRIKAETEEMRDRIHYLQEIQGKLENEIQKLRYDIKKEENEYKYARVEIKNLQEQLPRIEEQLKNQKLKMEQTKADPMRVNEMKTQLEEKRKIFEQSESAAKQKGIQVAKITKEIETIQSTKLKSVKKKIDESKQLLTKLTKNISELKVEITTSSRKIVKAEQKIRDLNNDLTKCRETLEKSEIDIKANDEKITKLNHHLTEIEGKIETTKTDSSDIKKEIDALQKQINKGQMKRLEFEKEIQVAEKQIAEARIQVPHWENQLAVLKLQLIPNHPMPEPLKVYSEEELSAYKTHDLQYNCSVQESNLHKVTPNLAVIDEYDRKRDVYLERVKILEEITNKRNLLRNIHSTLKTKRYVEFTKGFQIITTKLKEMYQMITQGGDAELELVDSMDPFHEGVAFSVRPPKKSWKSISNLSGGEKTLSSLALVFALHYYKPSPLYFMDEIDAALDFRNVSIVANYIKNRTKDAQFIIISLRSNMFELSDCLTGIYKVDESTDALMINNVRPCNSTQQQNGIIMPNSMVNGNDNNNNNGNNSNNNNHSNNDNNNISNNNDNNNNNNNSSNYLNNISNNNNNSHNNSNNNNNSVNNHEETDNNEVGTTENNESVVNSGNLNNHTSPTIQNCSTSSLSSASASPSSKQYRNPSIKRSGLEINTDNDEADDTSVSVLSNDSTILNNNDVDNDNEMMGRASKKMRTS